jgi:hypothetical protein
MNTLSTILLAAIALPILANLGSVFWQILRDRPFRVIYLPLAARIEISLRLLGIGIAGLLLFDRLVTQYVTPDVTALVLLLGFGLINGLSVYYRWRSPLRIEASRP